MTPVLPAQLLELIPNSQDSLCEAFKKAIKFRIRFYNWFIYAYDGVGNFNTGFAADICTVLDGCPS